MAEVIKEVHTFIVHLMCDVKNCDGEMVPTGIKLTSNPPIYPHRCNKCNAIKDVTEFKYPKVTHKEIRA